MKTYIKSSNNPGVTLEVEYYPYDRYGSGSLKRAKVKGNDLLEALSKMCDHMCLYLDSDIIEVEGYTAEEVLQRLESYNGDGCDYIMYIKDLGTGQLLLQGDYEGDEDDTEEW